MKTRKNVNTEMSITTSTNLIIQEAVNSVISEDLNHFSTTKRPRAMTDDDNRYLYSKDEVKTFFNSYLRDDVHCNIIRDEFGGVFCYELTRIPEIVTYRR